MAVLRWASALYAFYQHLYVFRQHQYVSKRLNAILVSEKHNFDRGLVFIVYEVNYEVTEFQLE